jgi:hypothetical protein
MPRTGMTSRGADRSTDHARVSVPHGNGYTSSFPADGGALRPMTWD